MTSNRNHILLPVTTICLLAIGLFSSNATSAHDSLRHDIKYATVCTNTERLEQIGANLRSAFASDFRQSGVYRKLAWNAGKLKRQSARLHRIAHRKSECRWEKQIRNLDEIVCTLEKRVAEAHRRIANRIDPPCYSTALKVDRMIEDAKQLVAGLNVATGVGEVMVEQQTIVTEPVPIFETAPNYNPGPPTVLPEFPAPTMTPPRSPLEVPFELPQETPLQSPANSAPSLNPPQTFDIPVVPDGATIIPDVPKSVLESQLSGSHLSESQLPIKSFEETIAEPLFDGPALTGPLETIDTTASYDEAKVLKKLNSK